MSELRALIVDDEPLARRGIRQLAEAHPDLEIVGECRDGREAVRAVRTLSPDLVFLDVQMPVVDGFGVLRAIGAERMPAVIFVTAYDHFAVRAFEAHALDYLVKPVSDARFAQALERVRERRRDNEAVALSQRLLALLAEQSPGTELPTVARELERRPHVRRIVVPTAAGELVLDAAEIEWIEADDYYAAVHARGRRHLIRMSLAMLEERLDPRQFVRVHRSAIVAVDRIRALEHATSTLVLRDGTRVPVSRRRRERVAGIVRRIGP
jgi:two-component system, LytTR family, response regulator